MQNGLTVGMELCWTIKKTAIISLPTAAFTALIIAVFSPVLCPSTPLFIGKKIKILGLDEGGKMNSKKNILTIVIKKLEKWAYNNKTPWDSQANVQLK